MPLLSNQEAMRQEVLKHVAIGMSATQAQAIMESNGFDCKISHDGGTNKLCCHASQLIRSTVSRLYVNVIFVYDQNGIVKDCQVDIHSHCL
jgi:hypothetical protein